MRSHISSMTSSNGQDSRRHRGSRAVGLVPFLLIVVGGCAPGVGAPDPGSGGAPASSGGSGGGGTPATSTGGAVGSGGAVAIGTGGSGTGGGSSGGTSTGGSSTGGAATGGASTGGAAAGGAASGGAGAATGGRGGSATGGASAGGTGGGTSAGGNGGAAGGGSGTGCAAKGYKLCEDFETGTPGSVPMGWTTFKGYGAGSPQDAALATDQFRSGRMALKSDSMATGQSRIQKSLAALGPTATKHWGRVFYRFQSPAVKPTGGVMHITMTGLMGPSGENRVVDIVQNTSGAHQWLYNLPDDSCCAGSAYSWMLDAAWHCAEWYVDVATNSFRFFADSREVTQIGFTGRTNAKMSNYTSLILGSTFYQTPPSRFVMWFDDLAINDSQIGCQ